MIPKFSVPRAALLLALPVLSVCYQCVGTVTKKVYTLQGTFPCKIPRIIYIANDVFAAGEGGYRYGMVNIHLLHFKAKFVTKMRKMHQQLSLGITTFTFTCYNTRA